jgi:hypothetical protein
MEEESRESSTAEDAEGAGDRRSESASHVEEKPLLTGGLVDETGAALGESVSEGGAGNKGTGNELVERASEAGSLAGQFASSPFVSRRIPALGADAALGESGLLEPSLTVGLLHRSANGLVVGRWPKKSGNHFFFMVIWWAMERPSLSR